MNITLADRFLAISPSLVAVVLCGIAPELTKVAKWRIVTMLAVLDAVAASGATIPPHLSTEYIGDYVEYVVDVVQVLPGFLLPIVTVLASLNLGLNLAAAVVILAVLLLALTWLLIRVLGTDPVTYVSKKILRRYTHLSAAWLVINAAAAIGIGFAL